MTIVTFYLDLKVTVGRLNCFRQRRQDEEMRLIAWKIKYEDIDFGDKVGSKVRFSVIDKLFICVIFIFRQFRHGSCNSRKTTIIKITTS